MRNIIIPQVFVGWCNRIPEYFQSKWIYVVEITLGDVWNPLRTDATVGPGLQQITLHFRNTHRHYVRVISLG